MTSVTTKPDSSHPTGETAVYLFDNWFDPIEGGVRDRVREFIHAMIEGELDMALSRPRYARHAKSPSGEAEETRVRLDRKATSVSLLVVLGVREDGQKVLLAIKSMGGESTEGACTRRLPPTTPT